MESYMVLAAIFIAIGLWHVGIAVLGFFPRFRATAVGTLVKANTRRNVRDRHGHLIPIMTRYVYVYTVRGREYAYSCEGFHSKRRLFPKAEMVFVRWFPRRAYPNRFLGTREWAVGLTMLFVGGLLVYTILSAPLA